MSGEMYRDWLTLFVAVHELEGTPIDYTEARHSYFRLYPDRYALWLEDYDE